MKIQLNRAPYMCPVIDDHTGAGSAHYIFHEGWTHIVINFQKESEDDMSWKGKVITTYEGAEGWLQVELLKECFNIIEE